MPFRQQNFFQALLSLSLSTPREKIDWARCSSYFLPSFFLPNNYFLLFSTKSIYLFLGNSYSRFLVWKSITETVHLRCKAVQVRSRMLAYLFGCDVTIPFLLLTECLTHVLNTLLRIRTSSLFDQILLLLHPSLPQFRAPHLVVMLLFGTIVKCANLTWFV